MKAIALKHISPIIGQGSLLNKEGDFYILNGHTKKKMIKTKLGEDNYETPNFYHKEIIEKNKDYFKVKR